jgi:hypothetical protein
VGRQRRVEQGEVGGVGDHAGVEQGVVGKAAVGPEPDPPSERGRAWLLWRALQRMAADVADVERLGPVVPGRQPVAVRRHQLRERRQRLGIGHLGHGRLMLGAGFVDVEGRRQVEDGLPVLDADHPPGGERAAVTDAVDLVDDGRRRIAGSKEVGVEGVDGAALDRAPRRHQRLARHLAAEDPQPVVVGAQAAEQVHLDPLEVEQVDELVERLGHPRMVAGRGGSPASVRRDGGGYVGG